MHEEMKSRLGIKCANCSTCMHLGSDSDGGEPEYSVNWQVCYKFDRYHHLKPFPFKTEQKCWEPDFWASKFTEIVNGSDESMDRAIDAFVKARDITHSPQTNN